MCLFHDQYRPNAYSPYESQTSQWLQSLANTEAPALWCRVGSHGTRNLTKGSNYKKEEEKKKKLWEGAASCWDWVLGGETLLQFVAPLINTGAYLSPGPSFCGKKLQDLMLKKQKPTSGQWGKGKKNCSFLDL